MPQRPAKKRKPGSLTDRIEHTTRPDAPINAAAAVADLREQLTTVAQLAAGIVAVRPDAVVLIPTIIDGMNQISRRLTDAARTAYRDAGQPAGTGDAAMRSWLAEQVDAASNG